MKIPCLRKEGLELFSSTADQRILLGEKVFLDTHYPLQFRRYKGQQFIEQWIEDDILRRLTDSNSVGNRVFILYGAAGSGKSESIRWLQEKLKQFDSNKKSVRISRTELDPLIILQKLLELADKNLPENLLINWDTLKRKPVTLANKLVWETLSSTLDDDELIIPVSYKLRPVIENNLRKNFLEVEHVNQLEDKSLELISLEEVEEIIGNCAIPIQIDYEQFRKRLVSNFEEEVLGGYNFTKTLQEVGRYLLDHTGQRPVLFIDDLVQSMNIYASELLDFFITIEEGDWDVVIGLTPSSFESTKRGKELLNRINYLDTFDDRLYKLWLTDDSGYTSYTINNETVKEFTRYYLSEYKKINGFDCGSKCFNYNLCLSLQWGAEGDIELTPLNQHLIQRCFESLIKGKGSSRQMIVSVGEYILSIIENKEISFLQDRINREKFINVGNGKLKILLESYVPIWAGDDIDITDEFLKVCEISDVISEPLNVIEIRELEAVSEINDRKDTIMTIDPHLRAVKDWLEKREVNKELLRNLRSALYMLLKETNSIREFKYQYSSRLTASIKREKTIEGCKIPLSLEGIDKFKGIAVRRGIGQHGLDVILLSKNNKNREDLINNLLSNITIREMMVQTRDLTDGWRFKFEKIIGITTEEIAFLMFVMLFYIEPLKSYPILLVNSYQMKLLKDIPGEWGQGIPRLNYEEREFIENIFMDWFQLRENLYDGAKLLMYIKKYPSINIILERLVRINPKKLSGEYKVGNTPIKALLSRILNIALQYKRIINDKLFINYCTVSMDNIRILRELKEEDLGHINSSLEEIQKYFAQYGYCFKISLSLEQLDSTTYCERVYPENIAYVYKNINTPQYQWVGDIREFAQQILLEVKKLYNLMYEKIKNLHFISDNIENQFLLEEIVDCGGSIFEIIEVLKKYQEYHKIIISRLDWLRMVERIVFETNKYFSESLPK